MNIAFVCDEYPPAPHGGIGTFVHTMSHALVSAGHRVAVVGIAAEPAHAQDGGVEVVRLRGHRGPGISWVLDRLAIRKYLAAKVAAGSVDIIEVPDYLGCLPFPFTACPVVVRLHLAATVIASRCGTRRSRMCQWSERETLTRFRNWIAVSRYALDLTVHEFGVVPVDPTIVYYPVSLPERQTIDAPEKFVLFVGTVSRRKGAMLLAEAASRFLPKYPDLHLVYVGEIETLNGTSLAQTIRETAGSDLAGRIHFTGRASREVACEYMRRATVFVFPSQLETFGIVVAEAMLAECAVLVPATPPFTEFVRQRESGILVSGWDPGTWSTRIEEVLSHREFAHQLGLHARSAIAGQCDVSTAVEGTLSFYDRVLAWG